LTVYLQEIEPVHKNHLWIAVAFAVAVTGTVFAVALPPNLPAALEAQQKLAQERPADAKVANDLGNLLHMAGSTDQAEEAYRRAAELSPEDPVPHYNLGLLLQERGKTKAALKEFMVVAKYDPSNAWAFFQIGAISESFGNRSEAIDAYAAAFSLDPSLASPTSNPQIIESELVYEAMVRGYRNNGARPLAPKVYDDPNRIARLLVAAPQTENEAMADEMAGTSESLVEEGSMVSGGNGMDDERTSSRTSLRGEEDGDESPSTERQVLTPDTIERGGTLGQVNRPGRGRAARPASRPTAVTRERSSGRTSTRGFRPPGSRESSRTRPGRVRFEPSVQSTGSLELELQPPSRAYPRPA